MVTMEFLWDEHTLTLTNDTSFQLGETVAVSVNTADSYANRLEHSWSFMVKADTVPPYFEIAVPVEPEELSENSLITLAFPGDIDTSRVEISLRGSKSGILAGEWVWSGSNYTFTPSERYQLGESITLKVNAVDVYDNAIPKTTHEFTVGVHSPWLSITSVELSDSLSNTFGIGFTSDDPDNSFTI